MRPTVGDTAAVGSMLDRLLHQAGAPKSRRRNDASALRGTRAPESRGGDEPPCAASRPESVKSREREGRAGAPVASQRCRILRPGANSIGLFDSEMKKKLPDSPPAEYNWICPALFALAGFEVSLIGRF